MNLNKHLFFNPTLNKFIFQFRYDANMVNQIKAAFDYRVRNYNPQSKSWEVEKKAALHVLDFAKAQGFDIANSAKSILSEYERKTLLEIPELPDLKINIPLRMDPFPYQAKGMAFNILHRRVLVGDVQGLGKTVQAIGSVVGLELYPTLIISPAHLKLNWKQEFEMWSNWNAVVMNKDIAARPGQYLESGHVKAVIVNYESLMKYFVKEQLRSEAGKVMDVELNGLITYFKGLVVDEIHESNNPNSQRYKVIDKLSASEKLEIILLLSGTPIKNKLTELMHELQLLKVLDDFGGERGFRRKYLSIDKNDSLEYMAAMNDLQSRLRAKYYYRREKHEVLKELPDKFRQVIKVPITNRPEYDAVKADLKKYLEKVKGKSTAEIDQSMRAEMLVLMMTLLQVSARGKIQAVSEFIKSTIDQEEKILLFAHHKEVIETLSSKFHEPLKIIGGMTPEAKDNTVKAFQNDESKMLILISMKAGATGITLTAASNVAFIELPWTPDKIEQCEDRTHRIGQKSTVNSYIFIGENTLDERVYQVLVEKLNISKNALGVNDKTQTSVFTEGDMFHQLLMEVEKS